MSEFSDALNAAVAAFATNRQDSDIPYAIIPEAYSLQSLESFLDKPVRKRSAIVLRDAKSFIRYFKSQQQSGSSIYGALNQKDTQFLAIFDDHLSDKPGWREHSATYKPTHSPEWQIWTNSNKKMMSQREFAQFIEDNLLDIVAPESADILEISRTLEAKKKVSFSSAVRLQNGQTQFSYEEDIDGTAAKGRLQIPDTFTLGISVFFGCDPYKIDARLRYRIEDNGSGKLILWYDLLRPHKVLEAAVMEIWQQIESETKTTIFHGTP